ncbi:Uma2 family endonuclease [Streptomyces sp. NBC_01614]|uniref:Uma2 family endonuclease n=1 Tax=Streptomyces sp. NBC_01614 TaxID=2975897 RepID=UPI00386D7CB2
MSVDVITHTEFPAGYVVFFGTDGKIIMTPQSEEHSSTIRSMQIDSLALGRHAKITSDVHIDFPADENSAPDLAILREDARKEGKRYSFEDVSTSSARKDYDDCTTKYGRYGIPIYLIVDPYAQEVVLHTQPTGSGYIAAHTHAKLPIPLADGRTFTLDLDELPRPGPEADAR